MKIPTLRTFAWRNLLFGLFTVFLSACSSEQIIVAIDGTQGNADSFQSSISADGRYVAFTSLANNLVAGDDNKAADVFVYDRNSGITTRVSVTTEKGASSSEPIISANGRYVAFISDASDLVANDTNDKKDVFVHDRDTGVTERISIASDGSQGNSISYQVAISADGRYVAFTSLASNLVLNDTNVKADVFVHDRDSNTTEIVSVASDGGQGDGYHPAISADGRYVAFTADSSNLVSDDDNSMSDIFVHDRHSGNTELVSVASDGTQADMDSFFPALSADGRYVAFDSRASNLIAEDNNSSAEDVFIHDRQSGMTVLVSVANDGNQGDSNSHIASISGNGRFVVFQSIASNLVLHDNNDDYDIFIHDRYIGSTNLVSIGSDGSQGNSHSNLPAISANGNYVVFQSHANNLVSDDNNGNSDIFFRKVN